MSLSPPLQLLLLFFIELDGSQALWVSAIGNVALMMAARRVRVDGAAHLGGMAVGTLWHLWDPPAKKHNQWYE